MAKAVSEEFKRIHARRTGRVRDVRVLFKKRFWNGSAMVFQPDFTELRRRDVIDIGDINFSVTGPQGSEIKASNVQLVLNNRSQRWLPTNDTNGEFKADAIATIGYEPEQTEFQIQYGYLLSDGTFEYADQFTGRAEVPVFSSDKRFARFRLTGFETKLKRGDAHNVSTTKVNTPTTPAAGDGTRTEFELGRSIWEASKVRIDAIDKLQGSDNDYSLKDMNKSDVPAKVLFNVAPPNLDSVDFSGREWLRGKTIQELVAANCDEGGVGPSERTIIPPTLPIDQSVTLGSQADWDASTKVTTESLIDSGSICLDVSLITGGGFNSNSELTDNFDVVTSGDASVIIEAVKTPFEGANYLRLVIGGAAGPSVRTISLIPIGGGTTISAPILSGTGQPNEWASVKILAGSQGPYKIRIENSNLFRSATVTTKSAVVSSNQLVSVRSDFDQFFGPVNIFIDAMGIYDTGSWETVEQDIGGVPTLWKTFEAVKSDNGGSHIYKMLSATVTGGPYTTTIITPGATILAPLHQFFIIRGEPTQGIGQSDVPCTDEVQINFTSGSLFIDGANFFGKDTYQANGRLASVSGAEHGFDGSSKYFWRPRTVIGNPVFTLREDNLIMSVANLDMGNKRVRNRITVQYGENYYVEVDSITQGEASPTSIERFGVRKTESPLVINDLFFGNDAELAEGIAEEQFNQEHLPKRRVTLECRIIPHMDLSDIASASWYGDPLKEDTVFGDPSPRAKPTFGVALDVLLREMKCKIILISISVFKAKMRIVVEEIL